MVTDYLLYAGPEESVKGNILLQIGEHQPFLIGILHTHILNIIYDYFSHFFFFLVTAAWAFIN